MRPLEGLLVIAVEQAVAAPFCTARLVQAGARVIKIERTEGDFARYYDTAAKGESSYFAWLNQGKESIVLDFKTEDGARLLRAMLAKADVFVQNLGPGALQRAGFGNDDIERLNGRLITCDISGYGAEGEVAKKPAYDLLVQAESGLVSVSGSPGEPGRIGVSVCDISAGMAAYSGVLEALLQRSRTGKGSHLGVSLFDVAADWMAVPYLHARYGDGAPKPVGLRHPSIAPYGGFVCADGKTVLIAIQNEREWVRLCAEVFDDPELAELPEFSSNNNRVAHRPALEAAITHRTAALASSALTDRLSTARIAFGTVNTPDDLASHPAFQTTEAATADGQVFTLPANPVRWLDAELEHKITTPKLGEHTAAITQEFIGEKP
jgi:crotonobetainyl-CoA:carnitine CoA-transferase CaiB-like acyl-CoA transferase